MKVLYYSVVPDTLILQIKVSHESTPAASLTDTSSVARIMNEWTVIETMALQMLSVLTSTVAGSNASLPLALHYEVSYEDIVIEI